MRSLRAEKTLAAALCLVGASFALAALFGLKCEKRIKELMRKARLDSLTGILNREAFENAVGAALFSRPCGAMLMFDLDEFKRLNDLHGHDAGDRTLRAVSFALKSALRRDDLCGRLGGDEFAAFLSGVSDESDARDKAARIKLALGFPCSIGVALAPRDGDSFQTLYKKSDVALYEAKRSGKNRLSVYRERAMEG